MQKGEVGIFKRIVNFQKLMAMYVFTTDKSRQSMAKNGNYKADIFVVLASMFSTYILSFFFSMMLTSFLIMSLMLLPWVLYRDSPILWKTMPVKKSFVISNLLLLHPLYFLVMSMVIFANVLPGAIMGAVQGKQYYYPVRLYLILFILSFFIYAVWLTVYLIRNKCAKIITTLALLSVSAATVLFAWKTSFPLSSDTHSVTVWADQISTSTMLIFAGAALLIISILYLVCVKLCERFW